MTLASIANIHTTCLCIIPQVLLPVVLLMISASSSSFFCQKKSIKVAQLAWQKRDKSYTSMILEGQIVFYSHVLACSLLSYCNYSIFSGRSNKMSKLLRIKGRQRFLCSWLVALLLPKVSLYTQFRNAHKILVAALSHLSNQLGREIIVGCTETITGKSFISQIVN